MGVMSKIRAAQGYASLLGTWKFVHLFGSRLFKKSPLLLRVKGIPHAIWCRPITSDPETFRHIFIDRDCDVPMTTPPRFIIDGGANVGYASVLLANLYPHAYILAVEPDSENLRVAEQNCRPYPNVHLLEGGIWATDTLLGILNPEAESWAYCVGEVVPSTPGALRGYSIATLAQQAGFETIDLIKLDIEGAEAAIFAHSDLSWLEKVKTLVVEIHGDKAHQAVSQALEGKNFRASRQGEKFIFTRIEEPTPHTSIQDAKYRQKALVHSA